MTAEPRLLQESCSCEYASSKYVKVCEAISTMEGIMVYQGQIVQLGRHDRDGIQNLETRLIESFLVVCLAVSSLSLIDTQKTVAVPIRG